MTNMSKTTKSVNLVLIGSSMILAGCRKEVDCDKLIREDPEAGRACVEKANQQATGRGGRHGFVPIPIPIGGFGRSNTGGSSAPKGSAVSSRGGFGATGQGVSAGG